MTDNGFDTDQEERQGAWVVLAMFGVAAAVPPLGCLWILQELESTATTSAVGIGPLLGGLTAAGLVAIALGVAGFVLVLYALVQIRLHGPLYVVAAVLTTAMALTPIVMGWNNVGSIPQVEDFDPGDCEVCAGDGACAHPWPTLGPRITARGECRDGRREGAWVFGTRTTPAMATFHFDGGLRNGSFETAHVRGSFVGDVRDGEWVWLRTSTIVVRGQYVDGRAHGRWSCLDESGDELTWVVLDRGTFVEGNGDVHSGSFTLSASDAENEPHLDGIACEPPRDAPPIDHFERMVMAE